MSEQATPRAEGGYVFISHAHKDIQRIRRIRNILEENGLEPICFYLRCLSDHDEIIDLIKREIDAREWFLLVDSANARASKWVKTEVEYIRSKNTDKIISVSLEDEDSILPTLNRLSNSMRVFLSYSRKDIFLARLIADTCLRHDLRVFFDVEEIRAGTYRPDRITSALTEASEKGCVVSILSPDAVKSEYFMRELSFAMAHGAFILPIIVNDAELPDDIRSYLAGYQHYHLKTPLAGGEVEDIVGMIENMLAERLHGRA